MEALAKFLVDGFCGVRIGSDKHILEVDFVTAVPIGSLIVGFVVGDAQVVLATFLGDERLFSDLGCVIGRRGGDIAVIETTVRVRDITRAADEAEVPLALLEAAFHVNISEEELLLAAGINSAVNL